MMAGKLVNRQFLKCFYVAGALLAGCAIVTSGFADETLNETNTSATSGGSAATGSDDLGEITVTARRRDESASRVPITLTAFDAEQLKERTITSPEDLQSATPGLTVRATGSNNDLNYSIRGQSIDAFSASSPGVVPYVNDVAFNRVDESLFYDLQSIQVLKGPQGTLFGRNTTGGAVLYGTATPQNELGGFLDAQVGNYGYDRVVGAIDIPLIDDWALLRVSGLTERRDGYVRNIYDGSELGEDATKSIRSTLLLRPTSDLTITTMFEYSHSGGNNANSGLYSVYPNSSTATLYSPAGLDATHGAGAWTRYLAAHPKVDPNGLYAYFLSDQANGPYVVDENAPNLDAVSDYALTNTVAYEVNSNLEIKNIFGFVRTDQDELFDLDGSPFGIFQYQNPTGSGNINDVKQVSDEQQFSGTLRDGMITYVTGLYFSRNDLSFTSEKDIFDLSPIVSPKYNTQATFSTETELAAYAQAGLDLSSLTGVEGLKFEAGYRYTHDVTDMNLLPANDLYKDALAGVYGPNARTSFSTTGSKPSWLVGLDYQVTHDLLLYVTQRGSWRVGGLNNEGAPPIPGPASVGGNEFLPETTWDVEVGTKYHGQIAGIPVALSAAAYHQVVNNVQRAAYFTINDVLASVTVNVPQAQIDGVELDTTADLTNWLQVGGNVANTNARYTKPDVSAFGQTIIYGPYGDTPRWAGTAFVQTKYKMDRFAEVVFRADVYSQTAQYFSNTAATITPDTKLPSYSLTNLRLDLNNLGQSNVSLGFFVRNLFDKIYYIGGEPIGSTFDLNIGIPGLPRTFGLECSIKF
jgi:iron complex outermembrane recepter protein